MKIIKDSIKQFGTLAEVQRELLRNGVSISLVALNNAKNGKTNTLRFDVLTALVRLTYKGDWAKAGKAIEADINKS